MALNNNAININAGFEVGSQQPLDSRQWLSTSEMKNADVNTMPDPYFAINKEDHFLYIFSKTNSISESTGYFTKYTSDGGMTVWKGSEAERDALPEETKADESIIFYTWDTDSAEYKNVVSKTVGTVENMSEADYQALETKDARTIYTTPGHIRVGEESIVNDEVLSQPMNFSTNLVGKHSIGHRGCYLAPENTLPSFILAKNIGWDGVEFDVAFTSDNEPVIIHDKTVDRTSDGTGTVAEMTLAELKALDFGSWFSTNFTGTRIPTFEEAIQVCQRHSIHAYIELHLFATYTQERVNNLVRIVNKYDMWNNVSWISGSLDYLGFVHNADKRMRLGYATSSFTDSEADQLLSLKEHNLIFADLESSHLTAEIAARCEDKHIPLEVFISTDSDSILDVANTYPTISGFTSIRYMCSQYLRAETDTSISRFVSSGVDASNVALTNVSSAIADSFTVNAHREDKFIQLSLQFTYTSEPSTSSRVLLSGLNAKYIPLYPVYKILMGYGSGNVYFMRIKVNGKNDSNAGTITCAETNAPSGTIFGTTVMYLI